MYRIKNNGLYINHQLRIKTEFETISSSGRVKTHRYGFFNKLSDIVFKGHTSDDLYSLFYFPLGNNQLKYFFQHTSDELSGILSTFLSSNTTKEWNDEYKLVKSYKDGLMIIEDKIGRECNIIFDNDGLSLDYMFYSFVDGKRVKWSFTFYPFTHNK